MNEEAQQVLADLLQRAVNGVDEAVAFSQAQIPDVVEQLLLWHGIKSGLLTLLGVSLIAISVSLAVWVFTRKPIPLEPGEKGQLPFHTHRSTLFHDPYGGMSGFQLITIFLVFPVSGGLATIDLAWLQILIAPKLYLLEYAAELVK